MRHTVNSARSGEYLSDDSTDVHDCLDMLIRSLSAASELSLSLQYPGFMPYTFGYDAGSKYFKVWQDNGTQRMVCFFVERANGDVWKGSWKAPVKNFSRGNILSKDGRKALTFDKISPSTGYFYPGI